MIKSLTRLWALTKPRLSFLVVLTTGAGIAIAPGNKPFWNVFFTLLGAAGIVGAANALNCYMEQDIDARMQRTQNRPHVTGEIGNLESLLFCLGLSGLSLILLFEWANPLTALLGLLGFTLYTLLYTPMKKNSCLALFVGAVPGALPPLMGWTSVTQHLGLGGSILFLILFFWQLPHFVAISMFRVSDYAQAGLKTIPTEWGMDAAQRHLIFYTFLLMLISYLPVYLKLTGPLYLSTTSLISLSFFTLCVASFFGRKKLNWSRAIFWGSLAYLPLILGVWILDQMLF